MDDCECRHLDTPLVLFLVSNVSPVRSSSSSVEKIRLTSSASAQLSPAQPSPAQPSIVTFSPVTVLPAPALLSPPPPRPNHPAHQIQFNDFIKFRIYSQIHHPLHNLHNIYKISTKSYVSKNVGWPQLRINLHNISFLWNKYV